MKHLEGADICNMDNKEQMNIVIVGHVDHGKSTVIGRLLADTGSLPEGKLESVKEYCHKNARPFEYAFLLDALKDEQAQGITIDTARCFFNTNKRDYIIIDAPGHIEFLKNMVTGASRAEAALLVIDAKEGIKENSKRHGHIVSMLGIRQVVVLVNKMDLVGFDKKAFENLTKEFTDFLNKINIKPINFIPLSALQGDNIAISSPHTPWYKGLTVLQQLDEFMNKKNEKLPLRMPVQDIYKFTQKGDSRRIVAGTILSGSLSCGDKIVFLPSEKKSRIKSIEGFNTIPRNTVYNNEAIGVTLETEIYIKSGELMVKQTEKLPNLSSMFKANIFWVGKVPMTKNKKYKLKIGTMRIEVKLIDIINIIDAAELNIESFKDQVERHDVAQCVFKTVSPIAFDLVSENEGNGRFVIVDHYEISGGGIIFESIDSENDTLLEHIKEREYLWEQTLITCADRASYYGHSSKTILITSGNAGYENVIEEIGRELELKLFNMKYNAYYLGISSEIKGSNSNSNIKDRQEHIRSIGELARQFNNAGQIFIMTVFNLNDYEAKQIKSIHYPNEVCIVNMGISPFNALESDFNIRKGEDVSVVFDYLVKQEIDSDFKRYT